jgi:hypothetical protein
MPITYIIAELVKRGEEDLADELLSMAAKKLSDDDMVQVPGFGRMKVSQLKKQVVSKAEDLTKRAKQGKFQTIGQANLDVFNSMWKVLHDLQRGGHID